MKGGNDPRAPRDTADGVGLDVVVTLPAPIIEQIEARAKARGETASGWRQAELIAIVGDEGSKSQ